MKRLRLFPAREQLQETVKAAVQLRFFRSNRLKTMAGESIPFGATDFFGIYIFDSSALPAIQKKLLEFLAR